jgi:hypothetical protein
VERLKSILVLLAILAALFGLMAFQNARSRVGQAPLTSASPGQTP